MLWLCLMLIVVRELGSQGVEGNGCGGVNGMYVCHPTNPTRFAICIGGHRYTMTCPGGLFFNSRTQVCDWPRYAGCGLPTSSPPPLSRDPSHLQLLKVKLVDYPAVGRSGPHVRTGNYRHVDINGHNYHHDNVTTENYHDADVSVGNYHYGDITSERHHFGDVSTGWLTTRGLGVSQVKDSDGDDDGGGGGGGGDDDGGDDDGDADGGRHTQLSDIYTPPPLSPVHYSQPAQSTRIHQLHTPDTEQGDINTHDGHHTHHYAGQTEDATRGHHPHAHRHQQHTQRHQQHTQRHKHPTQRHQHVSEKREHRADDGYSRDDDNAARHGKLRLSKSWWRTITDNGNYIVTQNHHSRRIKAGHRGNINVVKDDKFNVQDTKKRQHYRENQDRKDNSDRFGLAHHPQWLSKYVLSKSDTPAHLHQLPAPRTPFPATSAARERGQLGVSPARSRAPGSRAGLLPSFLPAAKRSAAAALTHHSRPSSQQRIRHQQPRRHKTSVQQPKRHKVSADEAWSGANTITAAASGARRKKNTRKAGHCSPETCKLPDCRCAGTDIPGNLPAGHTPQMILLTFDDSVNVGNYHYYSRLFHDQLTNPNGCPVRGTFFVSGDATRYKLVEKLFKAGHEIASHSLSHRSPTTYWAHAGYDGYVNEIEGMRRRLEAKGQVPRQHVRGMRVPFLQVGGDAQYQMLHDLGYTYDSSMVTGRLRRNNDPPLWPFTLDYPPTSKICSLSPCPTRSYPGLWEVPLVRWYGTNKLACAMPDACSTGHGKRGILRYLRDNFQRHYNTNRAPMGIFLHATWFGRKEGSVEGLLEFLGEVSQQGDVWVLTVSQMLQWMADPTPLNTTHTITAWGCTQ